MENLWFWLYQQVARLMYLIRIPDKIAIPVLGWFEERIHE